jgi:hypothetical protein
MASQQPSAATEIVNMALSGNENFVPAAEEASQNAPHTFLSLAPTLSASYPRKTAPVEAPTAEKVEAETTAAVPITLEESDHAKTRRSSSLSSNGSAMQKRRFLKLGPVHFGERDGDWSEDVLEE